VLQAERLGQPFLLVRDHDGAQQVVALGDRDRLTIGRDAACDVAIDWDAMASRVHAELLRVGVHWVVVDDGLSRNGTYVDGMRLAGRRRLADGDALRIGLTLIVFRAAPPSLGRETLPATVRVMARERLTPMQQRVLRSLCDPFAADRQYGLPATNQEIADALVMSVDGVKTHLRALFELFGLADLPRGHKRARLAQLALASGVVDLREPLSL
jgi:pSer/pThr/pTyr-binding forkhead associated (FHA) protein